MGWFRGLIVGVVAALLCVGQSAIAKEQVDLAQGRALAEKKCARCHAIGRDDKSKKAIAPPFRVLADRYSVWGLQEALAEGIVTGHPEMPKFVLTPEEIFQLLSYMDTLKSGKKAPAK